MPMAVTSKQTEEKAKSLTLQKRIGSIVYEVVAHFNPDAKENMNDKVLRLLRRDMEASY